MEKINSAVATNLKRFREQKNLSLDHLAKMTGVSKSMLAKIEHGDGNPTIGTVWKIANGLKIPFTTIVSDPKESFETVRIQDMPTTIEDNGRFRNHTVFPYEDSKSFEIYYVEVDPGGFLSADPHAPGTLEYILAFSGILEIHFGNKVLQADRAQAIRFQADIPHTYRNISDEECCRFALVIQYHQ